MADEEDVAKQWRQAEEARKVAMSAARAFEIGLGEKSKVDLPAISSTAIIAGRQLKSQKDIHEAIKSLEKQNSAEQFFSSVATAVKEFEKGLTEGEAICALHQTADGRTIEVFEFAFFVPNLVVFKGLDKNGVKTMSLVTTGAAALSLTAIRPPKPREPIGFHIYRSEEGTAEAP